MDAINEEFKKLLEKSGWNQSRAAMELDLKPPSISRYVSGKDKPSLQTMRLFKALLNFEEVMPAAKRHGLLTDVPDLANVEDLLHAISEAQEALQAVKRHAERFRPTPPNSKPPSEAQQIAERASASDDAEHHHPT